MDGGPIGTKGWRRALAAALALAAAGLAAVSGFAAGGGAGVPAPASFRLADGSVACSLVASGELVCAARGGETGAALRRDGSSGPAPAADVAWDERTPILRASESWWHGEFTCRVRGGVVCTSGAGSITVSTAGQGGVL